MHYFFSLHFHSCPANRHGIQRKEFYSSCTGFHWGGLQVLRQHCTENTALEDQTNFLNLLHSLLLTEMQLKVVCSLSWKDYSFLKHPIWINQYPRSSSLFILFSEKESIHSYYLQRQKNPPEITSFSFKWTNIRILFAHFNSLTKTKPQYNIQIIYHVKAKSSIWPALEQIGEKYLFNMLLKFIQLFQRLPKCKN